jgi:DNA-binding GntR family transcriptional regulator
MAQRKKDGALIDQLKDMVLSLQEENAELLEALENLVPLASREAASLASDEEAAQARRAWRKIDKAKAVIAKAKGGAA